ncbi:hypothetical protein ACQ4PT_001839 [Festuca glaucescens]
MVRWGMRFLRARQPGELIPGLGRGFPWTSAAFFDLWDRLVLPWGTGLDLSWSPVLRFGWSSGDGKKRWGFFENTKWVMFNKEKIVKMNKGVVSVNKARGAIMDS